MMPLFATNYIMTLIISKNSDRCLILGIFYTFVLTLVVHLYFVCIGYFFFQTKRARILFSTLH